MRLDAHLAQLLLSSAALGSFAGAEEPPSLSLSEEPSSSFSIERPTFTPTDIKAPFFEQFDDTWESRWTVSKAKKDDPKSDEDWAYVGEWAVEEPNVFKGIIGDKGLVVKNAAAHHAISAKFPEKIDNKGKTLVVQYEVKLQGGLECGGAYMKLLQDNKKLHAEEFSNSAPYIIMFGPDRCGGTNKVHLIIKHKNPKTGEYEEKHLKTPPPGKIDPLSNLYTLILRPDQNAEILINGESMKNGSLLADDFDPPFNPPKEIDDPDDKKPEDWVDEARIPDPDATKPDDWDEDAPYDIVDENAEKPDDWLDDEPLLVNDPEAEKPDDWNDEEDGDWIPAQMNNPKCDEVSGCGKWEKPMTRNPDYKGPWSAPYIDNPAYKGKWAPRKITNPNYYEDKTPADLEPMGAIGFEIWTMQKDILFDNIYIGHSIEDAKRLQSETWDIKSKIEEAERKAMKPEDDKPKSPLDLDFMKDPLGYVQEKVKLFITIAKRDPVAAAKFVPEVAGGIGVLVVTLLLLLVTLFGASSSAPPQVQKAKAQATEKVKEAADAVADAAASGADKVQSEVTKRTTRSSGAVTSD